MAETFLHFGGGLAALLVGAELLVRGASALAAAAGITPLVIGLTVVAFGTSAPELAVSVHAAFTGGGASEIAIGNVVGSNICNVLLILGLSALVRPLLVSRRLVRLDVPLMIGASVLVLVLGMDGRIGRMEGLLLFAGVVAFTLATLVQGRKEVRRSRAGQEAAPPPPRGGFGRSLLLVLIGLVLLVLGSTWLVEGAVVLGRRFGVGELVISLTIVAVGTSLPELATSVMASVRGQRDLAVGNAVGSNLFNLLAVLGLTALVAPGGVEIPAAALRFDLPVMIAVAVACLPMFFTGYRIARPEGLLFVAYYAAYTAYLVTAATHHDRLAVFDSVMLIFVIPLTVLTIAISVARELQERRRQAPPPPRS